VYNAKPHIASALTNDAQLVALVPVANMFDGIAVFTGAPPYPYITFEELANTEDLHADDLEAESAVTFRVHVWHEASTSAIASHLNRIMHAIDFGRNYAFDQDEKLDNGQIIRHKVMSFTGVFTV